MQFHETDCSGPIQRRVLENIQTNVCHWWLNQESWTRDTYVIMYCLEEGSRQSLNMVSADIMAKLLINTAIESISCFSCTYSAVGIGALLVKDLTDSVVLEREII